MPAEPGTAFRALLLVDLVDGAQLAERLGAERAARLRGAHDERVRALLDHHHGLEIDRSDGILLLFESAGEAAACALEYHRAVDELSSGLGAPLRARAGLHAGHVVLRPNPQHDVERGAKPLEVDGLAKSVAARIAALAQAGRTLLSDEAARVMGPAPPGAVVVSHGHYRLRGVEEPVGVAEIAARRDAAIAAPPDVPKAFRVVRHGDLWRPAREIPHALPAEHDAFVGRARELSSLAATLDAGARLVTIVGPAGVGKTRLARRHAWSSIGDFPGGAWFCDCAESRGPEDVASAVAGALDVPLSQGPLAQLSHAIAARGRCLVVLDNFEQVASHADATIGRWLEQAGEAVFVVTSRERLLVPGEQVLSLEPLAPDGPGVELFVARARAQRPDFELTAASAPVVREIVRLLDGLPLAIELAASRVRVLGPSQLRDRLHDRFRLLVGKRGTARQSTLRAAIDWSWDLLAPHEQAALAQASVFAGGFTLAAAEGVLDLSPWPEAPPVLDVVQSLLDKSLLRATVADASRFGIDETYFGMYVSIQDYAAERLRLAGGMGGASGPEAERGAWRRHAAHFATLGSRQALAALDARGGVARRRALAHELENLVAACRRSVALGDGESATACLAAACDVFELRGPFSQAIDLARPVVGMPGLSPDARGRALLVLAHACSLAGRMDAARRGLDEALALARDGGDRRLEAQALTALGRVALACGDMGGGRRLLVEALELHRESGDRGAQAVALGAIAHADREIGRVEEALRGDEQALAIYRELGDARSEGVVLGNMGIVLRHLGRVDEASRCYEASLAIHREGADRRSEAGVLACVANVHRLRGRLDEAERRFEEALAIQRDLGNRRSEGVVLGNLGSVRWEQGRAEEALRDGEAALAIHREVGNRAFEADVLANLGLVHVAQGRLDEARRLYEESLAIDRETGCRMHEGVVLAHLASASVLEGRADAALALFEEALAIHRETGDAHFEGLTLARSGSLMLAQGRLDEARSRLERADGILAGLGERLDRCDVLCSRAEHARLAGDSVAARRLVGEAEAMAEDARIAAGAEVRGRIAAIREAMGEPGSAR